MKEAGYLERNLKRKIVIFLKLKYNLKKMHKL